MSIDLLIIATALFGIQVSANQQRHSEVLCFIPQHLHFFCPNKVQKVLLFHNYANKTKQFPLRINIVYLSEWEFVWQQRTFPN